MKASELIAKLKDVVENHKTLYVMGSFGAPLTGGNVSRYKTNHPYNKTSDRIAHINANANKTPPVFGFDCVCLIKGILWGWNGNAGQTYGGAKYASNGVSDINADGMIKVCKNVSTDFSKIKVGSAVWLSGHIGVYIGDGLVIESSPAFRNCVQVTTCTNVRPAKNGENGRKWVKHGELPFIQYDVQGTAQPAQPAPTPAPSQSTGKLAEGDIVTFAGDTHHVSANASEGKPCKGGTAKITQVYPTGKHPYHIIGDKAPCNAYGWVDGSTLTKA